MDNTSSTPYQLSTLSQTTSAPRPTIPYSQFPRTRLSDWQNREAEGNERDYSSEGSDVSLSEDDDDMEPTSVRSRQWGANKTGSVATSAMQSSRGGGSSKKGHIPDDGKKPAFDGPASAYDDDDVIDGLSDEDDINDDEETGLTGKDKQRRGARKLKNSHLDQRIMGEGSGSGKGGTTAEEKKAADQNVVKRMGINVLLIGLWYLFSLSISIYNKWMFDPKHLDFHFPLFTTSMHMLVQFTLASLVLYLFPRFRPRHDSISNPRNTHTETDSDRHDVEEAKPLMTRWFYATRLGPCGLATGLDIGLGNMSLKFISLTFYTMCKSSALAFVLIFAFMFRLETPSWRLVAIIFTMTIGVIMMVFGEVDFSPLGFVLIISAAFFSGFRWALTQILLLRNPATSNPFSSIFFLAPIMCCSLLLIAVPVEGLPSLFHGLKNLVKTQGVLKGPCILIFPGIIAFLMTASEFALLQRTSVVTLSIAGICKEVVTISAAGIVFGDPLTRVNVSGLFVTIGAIAAYNYIKITKMREEALLLVKLRDEQEAQDRLDGDYSGESEGEEGQFLPKTKANANDAGATERAQSS